MSIVAILVTLSITQEHHSLSTKARLGLMVCLPLFVPHLSSIALSHTVPLSDKSYNLFLTGPNRFVHVVDLKAVGLLSLRLTRDKHIYTNHWLANVLPTAFMKRRGF